MVLGEILNSLSQSCKRVLSIDIDQTDIIDKLLKERSVSCLFTFESEERKSLNFPNKYFQVIGKDSLPFEDGEFDLIIGDAIFSRGVSLPGTFTELRRLLRCGGIIYTQEPNIQYVEYLIKLVENKWEEILESLHPVKCHYFFTMKSLARYAGDNGFKVEACYPIEIGDKNEFPKTADGYIKKKRYTLGPLSEGEYLGFLTKRFIMLLSKSS